MYESRDETIHGITKRSQKPSSHASESSICFSAVIQSARPARSARKLRHDATRTIPAVTTIEMLASHQSSGLPIVLIVRASSATCSKRRVIGFAGKNQVYQCDRYGCFQSVSAA